MLVIRDQPFDELGDLNVGDVFEIRERNKFHYYMVLSSDDINAYPQCPCVSLDDGRIRAFDENHLVCRVSPKLVVKG